MKEPEPLTDKDLKIIIANTIGVGLILLGIWLIKGG